MTDSPLTEPYRLHPEARADIEAIAYYIEEQTSFTEAERVANTIFDTIISLVPSEVRHRGHRRHDLTDRPLLFLGAYDDLIAYAPDTEPMFVIGILHGKRHPQLLKQLLDDRR